MNLTTVQSMLFLLAGSPNPSSNRMSINKNGLKWIKIFLMHILNL